MSAFERLPSGLLYRNPEGKLVRCGASGSCCNAEEPSYYAADICPHQPGTPYPPGTPFQIFFLVPFVCVDTATCPLWGGRLIVYRGNCYLVRGTDTRPPVSCNGTEYQAPTITPQSQLPPGAHIADRAELLCKPPGETCSLSECLPVGPLDCCIRRTCNDPPVECVYGQRFRVTWRYRFSGTARCMEPNPPFPLFFEGQHSYVADATAVYECSGPGEREFGVLVGGFGTYTATVTNSALACGDDVFNGSFSSPWEPPATFTPLPCLPDQWPTLINPLPTGWVALGFCCGSCSFDNPGCQTPPTDTVSCYLRTRTWSRVCYDPRNTSAPRCESTSDESVAVTPLWRCESTGFAPGTNSAVFRVPADRTIIGPGGVRRLGGCASCGKGGGL